MFSQSNWFNLNGKIDEKCNGQQIMLFTFKNDTVYTVDTAIVKNGAFHFHGQEYIDDFSLLSVGNYPDKVKSLEVVLEEGDIEADMINDKTNGTTLNDLYKSYFDSTAVYNSEIEKLDKIQDKNFVFEGSDLEKAYKKSGYFTVNFKTKNISNIVGQKLFIDEVARRGDEWAAYGSTYNAFQIILSAADEDFKEKHKEWIDETDKMFQKLMAENGARNELINTQYIDFEFQTPEGKSGKLSDYVGKSDFLYLEFWASWCGPCIAEAPYLKKTYEKYKDKGLEIIGISLDTSKPAWRKGLERIDSPWIQFCDFQGSKSKLTDSYHISGIPQSFLLDKTGKIIAVNLREEMLNEILVKLISHYENN